MANQGFCRHLGKVTHPLQQNSPHRLPHWSANEKKPPAANRQEAIFDSYWRLTGKRWNAKKCKN
jgi:hypothetical protein